MENAKKGFAAGLLRKPKNVAALENVIEHGAESEPLEQDKEPKKPKIKEVKKNENQEAGKLARKGGTKPFGKPINVILNKTEYDLMRKYRNSIEDATGVMPSHNAIMRAALLAADEGSMMEAFGLVKSTDGRGKWDRNHSKDE